MSDPMHDDEFKPLKQARTPEPREAARRQALEMAMQAFDAEQQKSTEAAKGSPLGRRLRSMFANLKGNWIMDRRLSYGFGTAAVALLLLPLGYQLYTSTAISPVGVPPMVVQKVDVPAATESAVPAPEPLADLAAGTPAPVEMRQERVEVDGAALMPAPAMEAEVSADDSAVAPGLQRMAAPNPAATQTATSSQKLGGAVAEFAPAPLVSSGYSVAPDGDEFADFAESPVKIVAEEPVSTFSIDVDTASYAFVRRMLTDGFVPEPDAVRIEELINYFSYAYPASDDRSVPFRPSVSVYPTPWNGQTQIVQIGIKGYVPPALVDRPSNLVFLIDTSGSMDEPDKLPLLKRAFALLVEQLSANDSVSIVVYAGSAGVVLEPTKATEKAKILAALENLSAGGSTAGAEGIELAYRLAGEHKVDGGTNRVILATDGDFNVGIDDPEQLKTFIKSKRDDGVSLSVLGFGQGNLDDATMQALAQNGNGNASYIDSFKEAQKVLVTEGGGTLDTIAKDVKIQVEFNPAVVSEYRLIGYETRALNREDFNNDKVDAGDVGAGTSVTALYEITPVGSGAELNEPLRYGQAAAPAAAGDEIGFIKLRYKLPEEDTSRLLEQPIGNEQMLPLLSLAPADSRFAAAVAAFGQKLKGSNYGQMSWDQIRTLAQGARGADEAGYRAEFMQLVDLAQSLVGETATDGNPCTAPVGNRNCH